LATLGVAIAAYLCGWLFSKQESTSGVATGFDLIAALVAPMGLYVLLDTLGFEVMSSGSFSVLLAILALIYLASFIAFRKTLYLLFTILFTTAFFFAFTNWIIGGNDYLNS
jgi:hypothetical protein